MNILLYQSGCAWSSEIRQLEKKEDDADVSNLNTVDHLLIILLLATLYTVRKAVSVRAKVPIGELLLVRCTFQVGWLPTFLTGWPRCVGPGRRDALGRG